MILKLILWTNLVNKNRRGTGIFSKFLFIGIYFLKSDKYNFSYGGHQVIPIT